MSNFTITIDAETEALKEGLMGFFLNYKGQLIRYLNLTLESKGERSDAKILIQGDTVLITQKTSDRGTVLQSFGIGLSTVAYDTLQTFDKYMVVQDGAVVVYAKAPDGIDQQLAKFPDLDTAIENINSTEMEKALSDLKKLFEAQSTETPVEGNGTDAN